MKIKVGDIFINKLDLQMYMAAAISVPSRNNSNDHLWVLKPCNNKNPYVRHRYESEIGRYYRKLVNAAEIWKNLCLS